MMSTIPAKTDIGLAGMLTGYQNISRLGAQIASAGTVGHGLAEAPDMASLLVDLKQEQRFFDASANLFSTSNALLGTLIDIHA